jgi:hypothetical protein
MTISTHSVGGNQEVATAQPEFSQDFQLSREDVLRAYRGRFLTTKAAMDALVELEAFGPQNLPKTLTDMALGATFRELCDVAMRSPASFRERFRGFVEDAVEAGEIGWDDGRVLLSPFADERSN